LPLLFRGEANTLSINKKREAQTYYDIGTRTLMNISMSTSIRQDLEKAVQHLQKATEINPNFVFAFHNLAHAWYQIAEYNHAAGIIQGFKTNPQEMENSISDALEYSLSAVDKALTLQKIFPQAHNTRAMILAKLFRLNEAKKETEIALQQNPTYQNAVDNMEKIEALIEERQKIPGYINEESFLVDIRKTIREKAELLEKLWKK
jgi:Tfp pilus assembly protein PilF